MHKARGLAVLISLFTAALAGCNDLRNFVGSAEAQNIVPGLSFAALAVNGHVYYQASVDMTSISMQNLLSELGLPVTVQRTGDNEVRISSALPDGAKFTVVVFSEKATDQSRTTKVVLDWEKAADSKRGFQVLTDLEIQKRPKPASPVK